MSNVMQRGFPAQYGPAILLTTLVFLLGTASLRAQPAIGKARPLVEIRTTVGTILVELFNETPQHRDNFLTLVRTGAYDSLLFHRVIRGFMVQGGDPDSRTATAETLLGHGGPGYTVEAEIVPGLWHLRGALAAAPMSDDLNPERRSSGSQFYVVQGQTYHADELKRLSDRNAGTDRAVTYTEVDLNAYATQGGAPHLDGAYTVFGSVLQGMDVIDDIAAMPTGANDRPLTDIRMFMRILR